MVKQHEFGPLLIWEMRHVTTASDLSLSANFTMRCLKAEDSDNLHLWSFHFEQKQEIWQIARNYHPGWQDLPFSFCCVISLYVFFTVSVSFSSFPDLYPPVVSPSRAAADFECFPIFGSSKWQRPGTTQFLYQNMNLDAHPSNVDIHGYPISKNTVVPHVSKHALLSDVIYCFFNSCMEISFNLRWINKNHRPWSVPMFSDSWSAQANKRQASKQASQKLAMNSMFMRVRYNYVQLIRLLKQGVYFCCHSRRVAIVRNDMQWYSYSLPFLLMQWYARICFAFT